MKINSYKYLDLAVYKYYNKVNEEIIKDIYK